jgi:outer membrane receptor protein involved in Fe transport
MFRKNFRRAMLAMGCAVAVAGLAVAAPAKNVKVEAGSLADALEALAKEYGVYVIYPKDQLEGMRTAGMNGSFESSEAFKKLIEGTSLVMREEGSGIVISMPDTRIRTGNVSADSLMNRESASLKLAQSGSAYEEQERAEPLDEIVVTAQKRQERLQDVPVPVSVIDASTLVETNQLQLKDYYTSIPGLNINSNLFGGGYDVTIRGMNSGGGNATVGALIDDVPVGGSAFANSTTVVPELDASELARIEVLRGPQGTLYGNSTIGGLIKYVTVDPTTDSFNTRIATTLSHVRNGDGPGYQVSASANIPVSDTWAVRVGGFTRSDAGYIDNVLTGSEGVNRLDVSGGRIAALWKPSDTLSLKLNALYQHTTSPAADERKTTLGEFEQSLSPGIGARTFDLQFYSATLKAKVGRFDLVSLTGYGVYRYHTAIEFGFLSGPGGVTEQIFGPGLTETPLFNKLENRKLTQEVRATTPLGDRFDLMLGAYYNAEDTPFTQTLAAQNPLTGEIGGVYNVNPQPSTLTELAGFADLTWKVTDQFDVQFGGRQSRNRQTFQQSLLDQVGDVPDVFTPELRSKDNTFTYLVTPRWKLSNDMMLYARIASGYRAGGPNINASFVAVPQTFDADTTKNYEIGAKGALLEQLLTFDVSVYYIDWKDIQLSFLDETTFRGFLRNGSRAVSQGAELTLELRPWSGMRLTTSAAYNDAELTEDLPAGARLSLLPGAGLNGAPLPGARHLTGALSAEQSFPLTGALSAFVGGAVAYQSATTAAFLNSNAGNTPAYAKTDLRGGVRGDTWTASLFANNIFDRRVEIAGTGSDFANDSVIYIRPRVIGLSFSKSFD